MDLFAPSHIIILLVVVLVLFGAKRLPGAAQSLGQSMHIFRKSVKGDDDPQAPGSQYPQANHFAQPQQPAPPQLTGQPSGPSQQQFDDIQRQLADLQRAKSAGAGSAAGDPQQNKPSY
jgi:sec-independent protein translocase protein TatA